MNQPDSGLLFGSSGVVGLLRSAYTVTSTDGYASHTIYKTPGSGHSFVDILTEAAWIIRQVDALPTATLRNVVMARHGCDAMARRRLADHLVVLHRANNAVAIFSVADFCGMGRASEREIAEAAGLSRSEVARHYSRMMGVLDGMDAEAISMLYLAFRDRGWV